MSGLLASFSCDADFVRDDALLTSPTPSDERDVTELVAAGARVVVAGAVGGRSWLCIEFTSGSLILTTVDLLCFESRSLLDLPEKKKKVK